MTPQLRRSEPPSRPDPRERLLVAATRLFCRFGINATGIDLVVSEAGVAKATLYKTFGSKEGLVEAVLEREGEAWRHWFFAALESETNDPEQRLGQVFPALKRWFGRAEFFGCPFINAIGEHDKGEQRLRDITLRHKRLVLSGLSSLAAEAGAPDPDTLSHQIGLLMDGAIVAAMVTREDAVADAAGAAANALVKAALPGGRQGAAASAPRFEATLIPAPAPV